MAFFDQCPIVLKELSLDQSGAQAHTFNADGLGGIHPGGRLQGRADPNLEGNGLAACDDQDHQDSQKPSEATSDRQECGGLGFGYGLRHAVENSAQLLRDERLTPILLQGILGGYEKTQLIGLF